MNPFTDTMIYITKCLKISLINVLFYNEILAILSADMQYRIVIIVNHWNCIYLISA